MKSAKEPTQLKVLISRNSAGAIGGAELSAVDQAVVLASIGHEPIFVSGVKNLRAKVPKGIESRSWVRWQVGSGTLRNARMLFMLPVLFIQAAYYALKLKPDVINPHSREDQMAFTLTKFIHKKPVVWKNAGDLRHQLSKENIGWLGMLNRRLFSRAAKRADYIYSLNSDDTLHLISNVEGLNSKRLSEAPSSILFSNYEKNAKKLPAPSATIIGTVIHLHHHKGVDVLIKAFKDSCRDLSNVELWIVGEGEGKQVFEKMAEGDERIKFFGHQDDISPYLSAIDIFVQPALNEPWGRNIKEAMYFGKAIIGSKVGGIAQQITNEKTGLLVKPGDAKELSAAITKLLKNKRLRDEFGKNALAKAKAEGDLQKIVEERILPLYERAKAKTQLFVDATPMVRKKIDGIGRYTINLVNELSSDFDIKLIGFWGDDFSNYSHLKTKKILIHRRIYSQLYKKNAVPAFGSSKHLMLCPNFVEFPKTDCRTILVIHDLAFFSHPETVSQKNQRYLSRFVPESIGRAYKVVTISEGTRQKISNSYRIESAKIKVVPPAIDQNIFSPTSDKEKRRAVAKYRLPSKYILFFGTLEPRKNIIGSLEAYTRLPEALRKQYPLVLAGGVGWQDHEMSHKIDRLKSAGEKIFTPGYIEDNDLPAIYSSATVFLFPSLDEGFGIPLLEAMTCGTPVVTSDIAVLKETAGGAALFADPNDYDDISKAVESLLTDKTLAEKMIVKGRDRAEEFSWDNSARVLADLLVE